jgi:hypothetical protein
VGNGVATIVIGKWCGLVNNEQLATLNAQLANDPVENAVVSVEP